MVQTNLIKAFIQKILPYCRTKIHTLILVLTSLGLKNSVWKPRIHEICAELSTHRPCWLQDTSELPFGLPLHPRPYSIFWMALSFVEKLVPSFRQSSWAGEAAEETSWQGLMEAGEDRGSSIRGTSNLQKHRGADAGAATRLSRAWGAGFGQQNLLF